MKNIFKSKLFIIPANFKSSFLSSKTNNLPGVQIKIFAPFFSIKSTSYSTFVPPISYFWLNCFNELCSKNMLKTSLVCWASSLVGEMITPAISVFFEGLSFCHRTISSSSVTIKANVFPDPVIASAALSLQDMSRKIKALYY